MRRARLILMLAQGDSYSQIRRALACNRSYISRWKQRFVEQRLAGLYARHRGRAVAKRTPKLEARIPGLDPQGTAGRIDPLEHPETGPAFGYQSHDGGASLETRQPPPPSPGALYGLE